MNCFIRKSIMSFLCSVSLMLSAVADRPYSWLKPVSIGATAVGAGGVVGVMARMRFLKKKLARTSDIAQQIQLRGELLRLRKWLTGSGVVLAGGVGGLVVDYLASKQAESDEQARLKKQQEEKRLKDKQQQEDLERQQADERLKQQQLADEKKGEEDLKRQQAEEQKRQQALLEQEEEREGDGRLEQEDSVDDAAGLESAREAYHEMMEGDHKKRTEHTEAVGHLIPDELTYSVYTPQSEAFYVRDTVHEPYCLFNYPLVQSQEELQGLVQAARLPFNPGDLPDSVRPHAEEAFNTLRQLEDLMYQSIFKAWERWKKDKEKDLSDNSFYCCCPSNILNFSRNFLETDVVIDPSDNSRALLPKLMSALKLFYVHVPNAQHGRCASDSLLLAYRTVNNQALPTQHTLAISPDYLKTIDVFRDDVAHFASVYIAKAINSIATNIQYNWFYDSVMRRYVSTPLFSLYTLLDGYRNTPDSKNFYLHYIRMSRTKKIVDIAPSRDLTPFSSIIKAEITDDMTVDDFVKVWLRHEWEKLVPGKKEQRDAALKEVNDEYSQAEASWQEAKKVRGVLLGEKAEGRIEENDPRLIQANNTWRICHEKLRKLSIRADNCFLQRTLQAWRLMSDDEIVIKLAELIFNPYFSSSYNKPSFEKTYKKPSFLGFFHKNYGINVFLFLERTGHQVVAYDFIAARLKYFIKSKSGLHGIDEYAMHLDNSIGGIPALAGLTGIMVGQPCFSWSGSRVMTHEAQGRITRLDKLSLLSGPFALAKNKDGSRLLYNGMMDMPHVVNLGRHQEMLRFNEFMRRATDGTLAEMLKQPEWDKDFFDEFDKQEQARQANMAAMAAEDILSLNLRDEMRRAHLMTE